MKQPGVLINHYLAESEHQLEGQRPQVELSSSALSVPRWREWKCALTYYTVSVNGCTWRQILA